MFYVYVYLDPRKPGSYAYRTPKRSFRFDFEPIYVGKGVGNRHQHHLRNARTSSIRSLFMHKLRRILAAGLEPVVLTLGHFVEERVAFENESRLIKAIGRIDLGNGPLCNLTSGGDGISDISVETRKRFSDSHLRLYRSKRGQKLRKQHSERMKQVWGDPNRRRAMSNSRARAARSDRGRTVIEQQARAHSDFCKTPAGRDMLERVQFDRRITVLRERWDIDPVRLLELRKELESHRDYSGVSARTGIPQNSLYKLTTRRSYPKLDQLAAYYATIREVRSSGAQEVCHT